MCLFVFSCVILTTIILIVSDLDFEYSTVAMVLTYCIMLTGMFADFVNFFKINQNLIKVYFFSALE